MADSNRLSRNDRSLSNAAVDGLLAGLAAGIVMAAYLIAAGLAQGVAPGVTLGHFDPGRAASPVTGGLAHLAVAGVYGAFFGLGWRLILAGRRARWPSALAGVAYGLILWLVAQNLFVPGAPIGEIAAQHFAAAHLLYGLVLGWLQARR